MQQHQKNINSKEHLSAQHSMLPGPVPLDQRPFRQAQYRILPCFTGTSRNAPKAEFRGSCAVSEFRAGYKAHPKQGASSCWALCWHSNPSSSNGSHSFLESEPLTQVIISAATSTSTCILGLALPKVRVCYFSLPYTSVGKAKSQPLSRGSLLFKIILTHWLMPSLDDSDSEQGK